MVLKGTILVDPTSDQSFSQPPLTCLVRGNDYFSQHRKSVYEGKKEIGRKIRFCSLYIFVVWLICCYLFGVRNIAQTEGLGGGFLSFWNFDKTKPLRK